jgi:omega-amidase
VSPARVPGANYQAWGHTSIVNPWGEVIATTEHEPAIVYADICPSVVTAMRTQIPVLQQRRTDVYTLEQVKQS